MDRTSLIGRHRPFESQALTVLVVVDRLGEAPDGGSPRVEGEDQLQGLIHLARRPVELAYVALDQLESKEARDERRRQLLGQVERLLESSGACDGGLRPFHPGSWERWDDLMAYLACRGLLRLEPVAGGADLGYRLTERGAAWLEASVYPREESLSPEVGRSRLLREVLPEGLCRSGLADYLRELAERHDRLRQDEGIGPEEDLLNYLLPASYRELS